MRAQHVVLGALAAACLALGASGAHAQSGYELFQQALGKERSNGEIQEAIALYERIVAEDGGDRALAARALLRMGRAYETLGSPEARRVYQRVLLDYPGQREQVARLVWPDAAARLLGPLSRDGRYLPHQDDETGSLLVRDLAAGESRVVERGLSPDGRFLAYSFPPLEGSTKRDIFVLATDGSRETHLVDHPADDFVIGWAPEGDRLVFASDRSGRLDAWSVRVQDGVARGAAELVHANLAGDPLGLTPAGALYYQVYSGWSDVLTAELDPETGEVIEAPVQIMARAEGANSAPDWSPDGRYLARRSGDLLLIRDMQTGRIRELAPALTGLNFHFLRWSPDGRRLLAIGRDEMGSYGSLGAIDVATGDAEILARPADDAIYSPEWGTDGQSVFYRRDDRAHSRIMRLDLASWSEHELYAGGRIAALAVCPEGGRPTFIEHDSIKVVPVDGGEARPVARAEGIRTLAWMRDGEHLLYEVWLLENFLPAVTQGAEGGTR